MGTSPANFSNLVSYPAKYSFDVSNPAPNCTNDYVVFTLPVATANAFNVIAFNNLYVDNYGTGACPGEAPSVLFSYNASQNNGPINSSPALSLDGTQIAFVENAGTARFNVLKWHSGDVSSTFGEPSNSSPLADCATNGDVAPCEYSVVYSAGGATLSSPYVDYATDTAYVTDDSGVVAAISPVFGGGQPAVKYSVSVPSSRTMTPPVYDSVSKNVFAADSGGNLYYIRTGSASNGNCASGSPPCLGWPTLNVAANKQVMEAPLVDSTSGTVFVFSNSSPDGANSSVVQTTTTLSVSRVATIGPTGNQNVFAGTFDNNYLNSPSTGLLYACGTNASNVPQLYAITFSGTSMNTGPAAYGPLNLAAGQTSCSPLTEVFNQLSNAADEPAFSPRIFEPSQDELYLSVANNCARFITVGCVQFFNITSGFPSGTAWSPVAEAGGTSGIIIDNVSNGASGNLSQTNIYFVTQGAQLCTGGPGGLTNCAVKLTQTALQ